MADIKENRIFCAEQIVVPDELPEILKNYSKAVIKNNPENIISFSRKYFENLKAQRNNNKKESQSTLAMPHENKKEEDLIHFKKENSNLYKEFDEYDDEFKPWIGQLRASSPNICITKEMSKPPKENINRLKYVFGYRSFDAKMNIKYTKDENKIVYTSAALGILLDKKTNKQKYFINHERDIVSLCIHPNKSTIATGELDPKGKPISINLYIWNINNLPEKTNVLYENKIISPEEVTNLKGILLRSICILQFSPDGNKLVGCGQDEYNSIALWDTSDLNKIILINIIKVDYSRILDITWVNNEEFVAVGSKFIKYFKIKDRNITSSKGIFGKLKLEPLCSICSAFNRIFTGTIKGNIIQWNEGKIRDINNICKNGPIYCLYYNEKEKLMFSGGADGVIIAYDNEKLNEKYRLEINKITNSPTDCGIRSMDMNSKGEMVVGTKGGEIVEINLKEKKLI